MMGGMRLLRWLLFLPVGFALFAAAQLLVVLFAENVTPWISGPVIVVAGGFLLLFCGRWAVAVAPRKVPAAAILIGAFGVLELWTLRSRPASRVTFIADREAGKDLALGIGRSFIDGLCHSDLGALSLSGMEPTCCLATLLS